MIFRATAFAFVLLSLLISGCGYAPPAQQQYSQQPYYGQQPYPYGQQPYPGQQPPARPPDNRDERSDRDERDERDERDDRRSSRGGDCEGDKDCEDMCGDMFRSVRARSTCEDLSARTVERLFSVFEALEDPSQSSLRSISFDDFEELMEISLSPLEKELEKYSISETRDFLAWVLSGEKISQFIVENDGNFEMLEALLENMNQNDPVKALTRNIDRGSMLEISIEENNADALEWIHSYLEDGGDNSANPECGDDKCTFRKYCKIAASIDKRRRRELMEVGNDFENMFQDLVDEYGTSADINDLDDRTDFKTYCEKVVLLSGRKSSERTTPATPDTSPASGRCHYLQQDNCTHEDSEAGS